jgi:hypothetical protein
MHYCYLTNHWNNMKKAKPQSELDFLLVLHLHKKKHTVIKGLSYYKKKLSEYIFTLILFIHNYVALNILMLKYFFCFIWQILLCNIQCAKSFNISTEQLCPSVCLAGFMSGLYLLTFCLTFRQKYFYNKTLCRAHVWALWDQNSSTKGIT